MTNEEFINRIREKYRDKLEIKHPKTMLETIENNITKRQLKVLSETDKDVESLFEYYSGLGYDIRETIHICYVDVTSSI